MAYNTVGDIVLDRIRDGRRPSADIEIGVQACNPVHLAKAANWSRKRMRFDATAMKIEEDFEGRA